MKGWSEARRKRRGEISSFCLRAEEEGMKGDEQIRLRRGQRGVGGRNESRIIITGLIEKWAGKADTYTGEST